MEKMLTVLQRRSVRQFLCVGMLAALMLAFSALESHAVTAPESGSFMYDAYDVVVNKVLKGAFGYVAAMFIFVSGIAMFFKQAIVSGVISMVCTALILKSDSIVTSLGMLI